MPCKKNRLTITGLGIILIIIFYNFGDVFVSQAKEVLHHTGLYNKEAAFRRRVSQCEETLDSFTLTPRQDCESVLLLVLVSSIVENSNTRKAIREYWGKTATLSRGKKPDTADVSWRIIFIVGLSPDDDNKSIEKESQENHDILRWEFDDNQEVFKSILGFHWVSCRCHSSYVLRTNDNVFVNIHALVRWLQSNAVDSTRVYTGVLSTTKDLVPNRNSSHKNYTPLGSYSESLFPAFVTGPICLMTTDVIDRILHYIPRVKMFPAGDAYTGVLVKKIAIKPFGNDKFAVKTLDTADNPCHLRDTFVALASTLEENEKIFKIIEKSEESCQKGEIVGKRAKRGKS